MSDGVASERRRKAIDSLPGTPYRLLEKLGGGSAAVVYRAEDGRSGARVAIKIMRYRRDTAPQLADRMRLEGEALAKLDHRNLVRVLDYGEADDHLYLVMEEAEGRTLDAELADSPELSPGQACFVALEVLAALAYVHKRGIVHRDIKPSNIMLLGPGGERGVKLFDFGILKLIDQRSGGLSPLQHPTEEGQRLGTARYVAPEQASRGIVDARSDLYSLAVVLYEMLGGAHPFAGCASTAELYRAHIREEPPSLASVARQPLPPALVKVVTQALSKDPSERPRDALQFASMLKAALQGRETEPRRGKARQGTMLGMKPPSQARQAARGSGSGAPAELRPSDDQVGEEPDQAALEQRRHAATARITRPAEAGEAARKAALADGDAESPNPAPGEVPSDHGSMPNWYAQQVRKVRRESGRGTLGLADEQVDQAASGSPSAEDDDLYIPMQSGLSFGSRGALRWIGAAAGLALAVGLGYWALASRHADLPDATANSVPAAASAAAPPGSAAGTNAPAPASTAGDNSMGGAAAADATASAGTTAGPSGQRGPLAPASSTSSATAATSTTPVAPPTSSSHGDHGF